MANSTEMFDEVIADALAAGLPETINGTRRTRLLDEALEGALQRAAEQDQDGFMPPEVTEVIDDEAPTCEELVREFLEVYDRHGEAIDTVIRKAAEYLNSPGGIARVQAFRASVESPDSESVSAELASGILGSDGADLVGDTNRLQGLQGIGVGVSLGGSYYIGGTAGADFVIDTNDSNVQPRVWWAVTFMKSINLNGGLELSIWFDNKPLTGVIMGLVADLYIPMTESYPLLYVRLMYLRERPQDGTRFTSSAVTIQFPFGLMPRETGKTFNFGGFYGKQLAHQRSKRSSLDVTNESTGGDNIAVQETTKLSVSFKNLTVYDYSLNSGSTLTLDMPAYFSDTDIANMSINLSGWSLSRGNGKLVLTATEEYVWTSDKALAFEITNVSSSNQPPENEKSWPGQVTATMESDSLSAPVVATSEFDLVWFTSTASITWITTLDSDLFVYTGGYPTWGTTDITASSGNNIQTLTTATNVKTGDVWVLGYIYNYNSSGTSIVAEVTAVWWQQNQVAIDNKTLYEGNPVSTDDTTTDASTCYYGGLESNGCSIVITVQFDS